MKIPGDIKILGIFGDPIEHTLSPSIQNAAFNALSLNMVYLPFNVKNENLKEAVASIKALNMLGVNITIPHKEAVMEFLDKVDEDAEKIGAVNTIVNRDGVLTGYNTDGEGYIESLTQETAFEVSNKNILMLGAGGAARGILYALLKRNPSKITIANRTIERAENLKAEFSKFFPEATINITGTNKIESIETFDLIINTTSSGMSGTEETKLIVEPKNFKKDAVVSEIIYKPMETPLLIEAEKNGLRLHKGLGMLIHQGALGFKLWTGKDAPVEAMRSAALVSLEAR